MSEENNQYQGDAIGTLVRDYNERIVFTPIGDPHIIDDMKVYAHADPGEVERLRGEVKRLQDAAEIAARVGAPNFHEKNHEISKLRKEIERLKLNISEMNEDARIRDSQIAERDALLPELSHEQKDALYAFYLSVCAGDLHSVDKPMIRQLCEIGVLESVGFGKHRLTKFGEYHLKRMSDAALSASAEPKTENKGIKAHDGSCKAAVQKLLVQHIFDKDKGLSDSSSH